MKNLFVVFVVSLVGMLFVSCHYDKSDSDKLYGYTPQEEESLLQEEDGECRSSVVRRIQKIYDRDQLTLCLLLQDGKTIKLRWYDHDPLSREAFLQEGDTVSYQGYRITDVRFKE